MIKQLDKDTYILTSSMLGDGYYTSLIDALLLLIGTADLRCINRDDLDIVCAFIKDILPKDSQINLSKEPR